MMNDERRPARNAAAHSAPQDDSRSSGRLAESQLVLEETGVAA